MWGFTEKKKKTNPDGVNLLASILVCYPEITTISYDPAELAVEITFTLTVQMNEKEFAATTDFIGESISAYHAINGISGAGIDFSMDLQGKMGFLHIKRELKCLTRGEVALIVSIMRDRFGDKLVIDPGGRMDSESQAVQEEIIERMLGNVQQGRLVDRLVGIREEDHVVVFDR